MKLRLNKSQRTTGFSKKVVFSLGAQVDLTAEEQDYVNKYKMGKEVVYSKERIAPENFDITSWKGIARNLSAGALNLTLTVNDLVGGRTIECKDITEMMGVEETIRIGCKALKNMLESCAGFEGEEVVEF